MKDIKEVIHLLTMVAVLFLSCVCRTDAEEVVRFNFTSASTSYNVDVSLFNELTPLTVSNFLNYVDNGDYTKSFIHRSVPNFVIQGGDFTFDHTLGPFIYDYNTQQFNGGLQPILTNPPINNEFKLSNVRGTIAMAKLGNDTNSATSQWFFNLTYNALSLDVTNGGFTVFGKVIGNGMDSIDTLAQVPSTSVTAIHPDLTDLPLNDISNIINPENITEKNLVILNNVTRLFHIDTVVDFGTPALGGAPVEKSFSITNNNVMPLDIGTIDTSGIPAEFTVNKSTCENTTLNLSQSCTMTATLTPGSNQYYSANISTNITNINHIFNINLTTPAPNIRASLAVVDFGDQQVYDPATSTRTEQIVLFINNIGDQNLDITSVTRTGASPESFPYVDNCSTASPLAPGKFCVIPINFAAQVTGVINADLVIASNDPDTPSLTIPLTGVSNNDLDGVSASIEDLAPNNGDGNNDNIKDSNQSNVFSIANIAGDYITAVTDSLYKFDTVSIDDQSLFPPLPNGINADGGILKFRLSKLTAGALSSIGLILPENIQPVDIYSYGPTTDNASPHWYSLSGSFDIFNNSKLFSPTGAYITRNIVRLYITDGATGDSDLTANGEISMAIAVITKPSTSNNNGSGSIHLLVLLLLLSVLLVGRSAPKLSKQEKLDCDI